MALLHGLVGIIEMIPLLGWLAAYIEWCTVAIPPRQLNPHEQAAQFLEEVRGRLRPHYMGIHARTVQASRIPDGSRVNPNYQGPLSMAGLANNPPDEGLLQDLLSRFETLGEKPEALRPHMTLRLLGQDGNWEATATCDLLDMRRIEGKTLFVFTDAVAKHAELTHANTGYFVFDQKGRLIASRQTSLLGVGGEISSEQTMNPSKADWLVYFPTD
jgi:hypothetical protein